MAGAELLLLVVEAGGQGVERDCEEGGEGGGGTRGRGKGWEWEVA